MRQGKLTNEELEKVILSNIRPTHPDVLLGAGVGEDCAAIRFGDEACVLSTDPITAAESRMGQLAVQVSLNDVASAGAEPVGVLMTLLAPPQASIEQIEQVIREASEEAHAHGLDIVGGHTEVTDAVTRIVVSTTVIGRTKLESMVKTRGAQCGDALVMSKFAAPEGTSILARDYERELRAVLSEQELCDARAFSQRVSVLPEGRIGAAMGVTAMHDATEGGILGACWEIASASSLGVRVDADAIPVRSVTRKICDHFGIDPLRLISSGVMLMTHPDGEALCGALRAHGIEATKIGVLQKEGMEQVRGGVPAPLAPPQSDEIYRVSAKK